MSNVIVDARIVTPDEPLGRLFNRNQLVVGNVLFKDVYLDDWLMPMSYLVEMYDHEVVDHETECKRLSTR